MPPWRKLARLQGWGEWMSNGVRGGARRLVLVFATVLALGALVALPATADAYVYWANSEIGGIARGNLDGTGRDWGFIGGATDPHGVAVSRQHVYWANSTKGTIGRANLKGTGVDQSFITGVTYPDAIAVGSGHVFWTDGGKNGTIGRANLDGTGVDQSFITGATYPGASRSVPATSSGRTASTARHDRPRQPQWHRRQPGSYHRHLFPRRDSGWGRPPLLDELRRSQDWPRESGRRGCPPEVHHPSPPAAGHRRRLSLHLLDLLGRPGLEHRPRQPRRHRYSAEVPPRLLSLRIADDSGVPPTTKIISARISTGNHKAVFRFSSSQRGSTFRCSLDGARFSRCSSPKAYRGLSKGRHTFRVRARNRERAVDPTPARSSFRV